MTTTRTRPDHVTDPVPAGPSRPDVRLSRPEATAAALGVALAVLTGVAGPGIWPVARALVALTLAAGTIWALRHAGRRAGGTAAVAFGLVGTVAGGGIGVPHALRVGLGTATVSGVAALALGLGLVVLGTARILRGARWWGKVLAVPTGLVIAVGAVFPLVLAVLVTNVPPLVGNGDTPADVGLAYEDVRLPTDDGLQLAAWYVPSTNGASVVLLPGATNTRSDEIEHAAVLARHGYGVLLLDDRGHGDSEGDAMLWGWYDTDVSAAVDYLSTRPDVTDGRIAAMGMSMGAEEAIGAAGADPRILAVVAEGASGRGPADEGRELSGVERWFDWAATSAADLMTSAERPAKLRDAIAAAAPRPVLVIAAGQQQMEIDAAHAFQAASPDVVELWIAPDTGHTKGYDVHPAEWESRVTQFLQRSLA